MYSQSNNRIITKYSEFLKEQEQAEQLTFDPPSTTPTTKHVNEPTNFYRYEDSDSGRESTPAHTASTMTVTSAEVHNIDSEAESGDRSMTRENGGLDPSVTLRPLEQFTSSKFSDIFTTSDSHALFQRDLFVQSENGSFLRDAQIARRRDTVHSVHFHGEVEEISVVHDLDVVLHPHDPHPLHDPKFDPRSANDLSTKPMKKGHKDESYDHDIASLERHYAGSIASSSLAEAEVTLRRELLNNIRAISKATFFEDIYTGHKGHGKIMGDLDTENSSDTNNNPSTGAHERELEELLRSEVGSPTQSMVVAEREGMLVFEAQSPSTRGSKHEKGPLEVKSPVNLDPDKESSIHQWILNSQHESEAETVLDENEPDHSEVMDLLPDLLPEVNYMSPQLSEEKHQPDLEVNHVSPQLSVEKYKGDLPSSLPSSLPEDLSGAAGSDTHDVNAPSYVHDAEAGAAQDYADLHAISASNSLSNFVAPKSIASLDSDATFVISPSDASAKKSTQDIIGPAQGSVRPMAKGTMAKGTMAKGTMAKGPLAEGHTTEGFSDSDSSTLLGGHFTPLFSRVNLENDEPEKRHRPSRPSRLLPAPLKNLTFSILNPLNKQVRYPPILPKRLSPIYPEDERGSRNRRCFIGKVPGVLLRQNMDQWVAKIVRFYVNGDEHLPRFEYRFRPGRDVHNFDGLCDVLSERLKLSRAVRFIFTLHGDQIESLDDLRHEHAYVVSATKKFKALNYGGEVVETGRGQDGGGGGGSKRRSRSRPPSAPSNRNPPIIRVRRERSLNGVVWGSPQQDWSSGSERNSRHLQQSAIEAEKVLRAAIEESQAQAHSPAAVLHKQIIRVINGGDPTVQSQVLLNTRVSQEFQELVKDLGLAVKIPRAAQSRMETLTGRAIQSYSQLRSQLKAGNEAFYIYNLSLTPTGHSSTRSRGHNYAAGLIDRLEDNRNSPFGSTMIKSISNPTLPVVESSLGKKFPNSVIHLTPGDPHEVTRSSNRLGVPSTMLGIKAASSSSLHPSKAETSRNVGAGGKNQNTRLTNSTSHPNLQLQQRRKSTKKRYEASKYLAHRSRSPSP